MKTFILLLGIFSTLLAPTAVYSQNYSYRNNSLLNDARDDIYTIGGAGMVGAIMGLSTLSFVEKPHHSLKNIVTGGALGIIVGVAIVASSQANKSQNLLTASPPPPLFPLASHTPLRTKSWKSVNRILFSFQF